nr:MAG TPA: hypothetical protein [Caudoviricetes sp.]
MKSISEPSTYITKNVCNTIPCSVEKTVLFH